MFAPYQRATRCSGRAQPGARALMYVLEQKYSRHTNKGIYVCRRVRGGSVLSLHSEGRAGDSGMPWASDYGANVARLLIRNAGPLGLQAVIWNRRFYSRAHPQGRYYSGVNPHKDHIHWELGWYGARNLTVARARSILNSSVVGGGSIPNIDKGPIGAFPLPSGHFYGVNEGSGSHSGQRYGDRLAIRAIQREVSVSADGMFGPNTRRRVIEWQKRYGLTADGKVGSGTWRKMRSA